MTRGAMRFEGSVAVVTGGGSGIGREIARGLGREGATLCLVGRDRGRLGCAVPAGEIDGGRVRIHPADLARDEDLYALARDLVGQHGRIDILVHSAGRFAYGEWESLPAEEIDLLVRTNLRAPVLLTRELLPALRAGRGQVVFINSSTVRSSRGMVGAYAVTKAGLRAFADSLRAEVNRSGIRVISVYPGRTATPMQEFVCRSEGSVYRPERFLPPADVGEAVIHALAMPRTAEMTDLFLRSTETADRPDSPSR